MERTKGEGKKMSIVKKLIAGSALVLIAGCYNTTFEGKIGDENVKLESSAHLVYPESTTLTIKHSSNLEKSETGFITYCDYTLPANAKKVSCVTKICGNSLFLDTCDPEYLGNAQEIYDKYISKIKEEIKQ